MRSLATTVVTVALLAPAAAHAESTPPAPQTGCFWGSVINTTTTNVAFPNGTITNYWYDKFTLPAGAKVVFHGRYPAARYMSLNSYYSSPSLGTGLASDAIHDSQIAPDAGSANPFLPGAKRVGNGGGGSWTLTVSGDQPPADPAQRDPNTLYAGTLPAGQAQPVELLYRIYVADKNSDLAGDGGLPQPTVVLADGTQLTGQAACDAVSVDTAPPAAATLPLNQYLALTHLPGAGPQSPAVNPGQWYRPVNQCHFTDPFFQAAGLPVQNCPNTPALTQYPTKDNAYISAYVDRSFGPAAGGHNVVVMTGKMPTTPATFSGSPFLTGGTQMRYWGVCTNESLVTTKATVNDGCTYEEQVPLDANRDYTIVISTPEDRPANATERCGVKWINWGDGDGAPAPYTRPTAGLLLIRNLLPDPSFTQAAQNIPAPGLPSDVANTMGPYMPALQYQSPAQFEANGCKS
jgi:hypothetical protein